MWTYIAPGNNTTSCTVQSPSNTSEFSTSNSSSSGDDHIAVTWDDQKQLLLDPKHPTAWYNLGLCQERTGKWKDAADSFRKALESELTRESAMLGLGVSLLHLDQFEHAMVLLDDYLEPNSRHQTAQWGKAVALHRLGRLEEAAELYAQLARVPS